MGVTREPKANLTAEAFLAWGEQRGQGGRYELIDGVIVEMAAERALHTRTKYAVTRSLECAIAAANLPCEALVDGMAVRVDEATVFEPDALVRCGTRLSDDALLVTDPVIVVEVTSPSTQRVDALLKLTRYFRNAAVAHYLIVMPTERSVVHHRRGEDGRIETSIVTRGRLHLDPPGLDFDIEEFLGTTAPQD